MEKLNTPLNEEALARIALHAAGTEQLSSAAYSRLVQVAQQQVAVKANIPPLISTGGWWLISLLAGTLLVAGALLPGQAAFAFIALPALPTPLLNRAMLVATALLLFLIVEHVYLRCLPHKVA